MDGVCIFFDRVFSFFLFLIRPPPWRPSSSLSFLKVERVAFEDAAHVGITSPPFPLRECISDNTPGTRSLAVTAPNPSFLRTDFWIREGRFPHL